LTETSFDEARQLQIDLEAILEGLDLDEDIASFAKGILAFDGTAETSIAGGLSLRLGVGLEYVKQSKNINSYIKGDTGLELWFSVKSIAEFSAAIGPFSANVKVTTVIDNAGPPLSIQFGLEDGLNYYLSSNKTLERDGFKVVESVGKLVDELDAAVKGQVVANVEANILGDIGRFFVDMRVSDINSECTSPTISFDIILLFTTHFATLF
jgi:hypothetical protein